MGILSKIFPDRNERELRKVRKLADKVVALEDKFKAMTDEELAACTEKYKKRYAEGETLDQLLPEAFATVREASTRVLGLRHFYVQIMGGIVLHEGRIAEMRTGEGKTLVATLPAYLNALTGEGMQIVTVNEYLAQYHCDWMGKVFRFLGLTVGVNLHSMKPAQKKAAYACDILYTTNNELGFDYLRDNMAIVAANRVQRKLAFAIVDEVDSILIDEARTPLIITRMGKSDSEPYEKADRFVRTLTAPHYVCPKCEHEFDDGRVSERSKQVECPECGAICDNTGDYEIGEKEKTVYLNENGADKAERFYGIDDLSDYENQKIKHYIDNALKAHVVMHRESNYIVVDDEVIIVDEFTGRQMIGRRFSNGLHQAIEAKEHVQIKAEDQTVASITFQNFFRLYRKLSGMTGTAKTEEAEFEKIYDLDVVEIPTNKPVIRKDEEDSLFKTRKGKLKAIVNDIAACYERKQPVLVGTVSVEKSEELSALLKKRKIPHNVLNAKNHAAEASIIAQAGKLGAVTIATNMAGRGTDIMLGGNAEFLAREKLEKEYTHEVVEAAIGHAPTEDKEILNARGKYKEYYASFKKEIDVEKEKVVALGGLRIIGTERHESRRIDNQLRGRSGRQGDPGSSKFYLSMEDDLLRIFGGDLLRNMVAKLPIADDEEISAKVLTKQIEHAQARVEDRNFSTRKNVLNYDEVLNKQREIIYKQRNIVLDDLIVHDQILAMMEDVVESVCRAHVDLRRDYADWDYAEFNRELEEKVLPDGTGLVDMPFVEKFNTVEAFIAEVTRVAKEKYEGHKAELCEKFKAIRQTDLDFDEMERMWLLRCVDNAWTEHLSAMEELRQGISLLSYGQRDPVLTYRKEGFEMFDRMIEEIRENVVKVLTHLTIDVKIVSRAQQAEQAQPQQAQARHADGSALGGEKKAPKKPETVHKEKEPGNNDPCPCGSGLKYKKCCKNKKNTEWK